MMMAKKERLLRIKRPNLSVSRYVRNSIHSTQLCGAIVYDGIVQTNCPYSKWAS
jgi:hypothetical protein